MTWKAVARASLCVLWMTPLASSAEPKINGISPFGVRRGVTAEVTVSGQNLGGEPRLIAPFACRQEVITSAGTKPDPSQFRIRLTVASEVAVGTYPIHLQTDDGLSNPFLFSVGQLPQVLEKEDNSGFDGAQPLADTPVIVEGQVADNDVDFFRFRGRKGERIVVDAQCARIGSSVDPTIRLTKAGPMRTFVAAADDSPGLLTDARLVAVLPEDCDYVVELSDSRYQGGGRPVYRLVIGAVPMAEEVYPLGGREGDSVGLELRGGTMPGVRVAGTIVKAIPGTDLFAARISSGMLDLPAGATGHLLDVESLGMLAASHYVELREPADGTTAEIRGAVPLVFNGRIDPAGDEDRFKVAVTPGQRIKVTIHAADLGSSLDAVLQVISNNNATLANGDDRVVPLPVAAGQQPQSLVYPDPTLEISVPTGVTEVTLAIRDLEKRGGLGFPYRVVVEPLEPDFELNTNESEVSVPRGGTAAIGVSVKRKGYTGPITLLASHLPPGLTARPGSINAGQTVGALTVDAAMDAKFRATPITVTGQGKSAEGAFDRPASRPVVFALQAKLPTNEMSQNGLFAAPALPAPVSLMTPAQPLEIAPGGTVAVAIKLVRAKNADGALAFSTLPLPPGLTVPAATIAEKKNDGSIAIKAGAELPLGPVSLALLAKGKFPEGERSIAAPAVMLEVVRPAALELATAKVELKTGATLELKGKVIRRGGYVDPVTVKLSGLPAGVKADSVLVASGASDFTVKLVAEPKAAVATAAASASVALQVDKKEYAIPPVALEVKVLASGPK